MNAQQFRIVFRHFLFRMVDLELLLPEGDMSKLMGQFAALLIFVSFGFAARLLSIDNHVPREAMLVGAWGSEHALIAVTMLVVGLFAVLSWDSAFPSRLDVLVLSPLPLSARGVFLARVSASATALSLTVIALNAIPGAAIPLALMPSNAGILDLVLSPVVYRLIAAYWITMMAAGAFIFGSILAIQGLAAQLLPRQAFLRLSAFLQLAAFCLLLTVYFLQPSLTTPKALLAPENQSLLAWLPSYWFLGLFQKLNGSMHPAMEPLAQRAVAGLILVLSGTAMAYALSYYRTLRKIVEEPEIAPSALRTLGLPSFGNSLQTAVVHFSVRTLLRSRHHRVMLAFYLGLAFAIAVLFMQTPRARQMFHAANIPLLFSSLVMMCACVVGTRVVFAAPLRPRANWIFRVTQVRAVKDYIAAARLPLFVLAVAPVWLVSAVFFLWVWAWLSAVGHLVVLGFWGMLLAWLCLYGFHKIPFTCSWLPGRSRFHMAFLAGLGVLFAIGKGAAIEWRALRDPATYCAVVGVLAVLLAAVRWCTVARGRSEEVVVDFDELEEPAVLSLGLREDS